MELQINSQKRILLEGCSQLYSTKQIYIQWKDMVETSDSWMVSGVNATVAELVNGSAYDDFLNQTEAQKIGMIQAFIQSQQTVVPPADMLDAFKVQIGDLDGVKRVVELYDMKINYSEKWVKLYTRCVFEDAREPVYVILFADNNTVLPNGQGGTIGEYDYLFWRIMTNGEHLKDVQTEVIQMRATPQGGQRWG